MRKAFFDTEINNLKMKQKTKTTKRKKNSLDFYFKYHRILSPLIIAKTTFNNRSEESIKTRNRRKNILLTSKDLAWQSVPPENKTDDRKLLERICDAYILCKADQPKSGPYAVSGMWEGILAGQYKQMIAAANAKDLPKLERILKNIYRKNSLGLSMSGDMPSKRNPWSVRAYLNSYADSLLRLATFVNIPDIAKDMDNELYLTSKKTSASDLWKKICAKIKIDPCYPNVGNPFGVMYKSGQNKCVIPRAAFRHLYSALRASELIKDTKNPRVLEIGGGFGGILYYLYKLTPKNKSISLVSLDVPEINMISSYFLSKALPNIAINFYGEKNSLTFEGKGSRIYVLPNWAMKDMKPNSFDLTINEDSFPEIPQKALLKYLERIAEISQTFYSINQDCGKAGQNRLSQIETVKFDLECINYSVSWMRPGYFERLYRSKKFKN